MYYYTHSTSTVRVLGFCSRSNLTIPEDTASTEERQDREAFLRMMEVRAGCYDEPYSHAFLDNL